MGHALAKVYVHFVWTTKERERFLLGDSRQKVKEHIEHYTAENQIAVYALAVQPEHVHLLTLLSRSKCIEDIAKLVKGESSHWINHNNLIRPKFSWQTGYWAGSVCYQHVDRVKAYIETQDEHHRVKSFREEFETILREEGYSDFEITQMLGEGSR
jgi:putative transposase